MSFAGTTVQITTKTIYTLSVKQA